MPVYEELTEDYFKKLKNSCDARSQILMRRYKAYFNKLKKYKIIDKEKRMLDIGCGLGYLLNYLKREGFKNVYGVDVSFRSLSYAQKMNRIKNVIMADVYSLPFRDDYFDIIFMTEVIEHLDYPQKAINEVHRVANTGCMILLTTPNRMGLMGLSNGIVGFIKGNYLGKSIKRIFGKTTCGPEHVKEYFSYELARMLKENGFKVLEYPKSTYIPLFPKGSYFIIAEAIK